MYTWFSNAASVQELAKRLELEFGMVHVLINNAVTAPAQVCLFMYVHAFVCVCVCVCVCLCCTNVQTFR